MVKGPAKVSELEGLPDLGAVIGSLVVEGPLVESDVVLPGFGPIGSLLVDCEVLSEDLPDFGGNSPVDELLVAESNEVGWATGLATGASLRASAGLAGLESEGAVVCVESEAGRTGFATGAVSRLVRPSPDDDFAGRAGAESEAGIEP